MSVSNKKNFLKVVSGADATEGEIAETLKVTEQAKLVFDDTDMARWQEAARAHGEFFGRIRPAATFVQVSRFIHPDWLVEIEADAVLE